MTWHWGSFDLGNILKKLLMLAAVLMLTGCNTVTLLWKPGVSLSQKQVDYDQCTIMAMREVPVNQVTHYNPGYYNAGTTQCNRIGNSVSCYQVGAVNIPGSVNSQDVNQGLRDRVRDRCLAAKGYQRKVVPVCMSSKQATEANNAKSINEVKCGTLSIK